MCVGKKSMCLAAKGRLQGWAAKLLLLWVGIFHFFLFKSAIMLLLCRFLGLRTTFYNMKRLGFRAAFLSAEKNAEARYKRSQTTEPQLFYIVCCTQLFFQRFFQFPSTPKYTCYYRTGYSCYKS